MGSGRAYGLVNGDNGRVNLVLVCHLACENVSK